MTSQNNNESLILLRNHLRITWKACATAFFVLEDIIDPKKQYMNVINTSIHSPESAAFMYFTSTRAFIRTAEKASKVLGISGLEEFGNNLDNKFPDHKFARDVLEHFEDYSMGEGRQQKDVDVYSATQIEVFKGSKGETFIKVCDLRPVGLSTMAYWIDHFSHHLEHEFHKKINPNSEWKGFYPDTY